MLNPFITIASQIITLYTYVIIAAVIVSLLISFNIVNRHQPFVAQLNHALRRLTEPALEPIRKRLPDLGIDISPIILIFFLQFINLCMAQYLWDL